MSRYNVESDLDEFDEDNIIKYLENKGYNVVDNDYADLDLQEKFELFINGGGDADLSSMIYKLSRDLFEKLKCVVDKSWQNDNIKVYKIIEERHN